MNEGKLTALIYEESSKLSLVNEVKLANAELKGCISMNEVDYNSFANSVNAKVIIKSIYTHFGKFEILVDTFQKVGEPKLVFNL